MTKRAFIVGINYVGTGRELRGCINDAYNIKAYLELQGFRDIELMLEKDATTEGILGGLRRLVANAKPGDVLVFHYSGHGSQLPSDIEADKMDEIICPIDLNWMDKVITDNDLRNIFNPVPNGVNVTVILDCCHSGTGLDQNETAVIGTRSLNDINGLVDDVENRFFPMPADLKRKTKGMELREWITSRDINQSALLIAASQSNQTAADATIAGKPSGAATYALLSHLEKNPGSTYQALIEGMTTFMITNKLTQRPALDGSSSLYNRKFLEPWADVAPAIPSPVPETPPAPPPAAGEKKKKDNKKYIAIAVVLAVILFVFMA